ncbi:hypothetical protein NGRA_2753 [Nosema granulosis]|uniref:ISXO2-like transposase domain-containing protein n=1 Tax=Nosema granulosis TaxID=83296 RepID=A0A9P6GX42_9MICR|nr:hypothetical protein NGRA_2753 [Nosema granulosis]
MFFWSREDSQTILSSYLNPNKNTVSLWSHNCHIACQDALTMDSNSQIGGLNPDRTPKTVEIDEFHFFKRKNNVGRIIDAQCVFGMIESGTRKGLLFSVPDRTADTLLCMISDHVLPGTIIISDKWRYYVALRDVPDYTDLTVNHSLNFVSSDDPMVHTKNIENLWLHVKRRFKIQYGTTRDMLDGFLCETMYKSLYADKPKRLNRFLISLAETFQLN